MCTQYYIYRNFRNTTCMHAYKHDALQRRRKNTITDKSPSDLVSHSLLHSPFVTGRKSRVPSPTALHSQSCRKKRSPHSTPQQHTTHNVNSRWQTLREAVTQSLAEAIPEEPEAPKQPWISKSMWDLIQQRIQAREAGDKATEQDLPKQVRSQARQDKTQWLKDRLAEREETCRRHNEVEMDKTNPFRIQAEIGLAEKPRRQAHQLFQTGADLCGTPLEPTVGPSTAPLRGQPRAHPPQRRGGPVTNHPL